MKGFQPEGDAEAVRVIAPGSPENPVCLVACGSGEVLREWMAVMLPQPELAVPFRYGRTGKERNTYMLLPSRVLEPAGTGPVLPDCLRILVPRRYRGSGSAIRKLWPRALAQSRDFPGGTMREPPFLPGRRRFRGPTAVVLALLMLLPVMVFHQPPTEESVPIPSRSSGPESAPPESGVGRAPDSPNLESFLGKAFSLTGRKVRLRELRHGPEGQSCSYETDPGVDQSWIEHACGVLAGFRMEGMEFRDEGNMSVRFVSNQKTLDSPSIFPGTVKDGKASGIPSVWKALKASGMQVGSVIPAGHDRSGIAGWEVRASAATRELIAFLVHPEGGKTGVEELHLAASGPGIWQVRVRTGSGMPWTGTGIPVLSGLTEAPPPAGGMGTNRKASVAGEKEEAGAAEPEWDLAGRMVREDGTRQWMLRHRETGRLVWVPGTPGWTAVPEECGMIRFAGPGNNKGRCQDVWKP